MESGTVKDGMGEQDRCLIHLLRQRLRGCQFHRRVTNSLANCLAVRSCFGVGLSRTLGLRPRSDILFDDLAPNLSGTVVVPLSSTTLSLFPRHAIHPRCATRTTSNAFLPNLGFWRSVQLIAITTRIDQHPQGQMSSYLVLPVNQEMDSKSTFWIDDLYYSRRGVPPPRLDYTSATENPHQAQHRRAANVKAEHQKNPTNINATT